MEFSDRDKPVDHCGVIGIANHPRAAELARLGMFALQHRGQATQLGKVKWLETEYGQPWSIAGFGTKFRQWCDEAGLTGLSGHGIRKATGIIAAERGATAHEIMSILGVTLEEAERYTREANAAKLADSGLAKAFGDEG